MRNSGLDKEFPLPLYYQLKEIIKSDIESGRLAPGDLIPSERELVEQYEISRPTVRQAINDLVSEGLLRKEKGKGTFVAYPKINQWFLENLTSFPEEMKRKGLHYRTVVLGFESRVTGKNYQKIFGSVYTEFYRIERLRFVEDKPVVAVTTYLPRDLFPGLEAEHLERESLYHLAQQKYELRISSADRIVEAVNISDEDAELLQVESGSAIHLTRTTAYLDDGSPFEYSIARYRGDLSSFTVHIHVGHK